MKLIIQRVEEASVITNNQCIGNIGNGLLVLLGVSSEDTKAIADAFIDKLIKLRIFADEQGKTNCSLKDVNGELLVVSQFTLYADCRKGNRPSFIKAGSSEHAEAIYNYFVDECRKRVEKVQTGCFGADMKVALINDGPFTIILDDETMARG